MNREQIIEIIRKGKFSPMMKGVIITMIRTMADDQFETIMGHAGNILRQVQAKDVEGAKASMAALGIPKELVEVITKQI